MSGSVEGSGEPGGMATRGAYSSGRGWPPSCPPAGGSAMSEKRESKTWLTRASPSSASWSAGRSRAGSKGRSREGGARSRATCVRAGGQVGGHGARQVWRLWVPALVRSLASIGWSRGREGEGGGGGRATSGSDCQAWHGIVALCVSQRAPSTWWWRHTPPHGRPSPERARPYLQLHDGHAIGRLTCTCLWRGRLMLLLLLLRCLCRGRGHGLCTSEVCRCCCCRRYR